MQNMYYYGSLVLDAHSKFRRYHHPAPGGLQLKKREKQSKRVSISQSTAMCCETVSLKLFKQEKLCFMLL